MKTRSWVRIVAIAVLPLLLAGLYGQFLSNPIVFDDLPFFMLDGNGAQSIDRYTFSWLELRSLPYATLTWTKTIFGLELVYFRIGNLFLHAATTLAIYGFLSQLFGASYVPKTTDSLSPKQAAWLVAVLFGLHPVATYAVGYLVQRTILMGALFSVLTLWVYAKACLGNKPALFWLCLPLYYLAVYSKEHAIMLVVCLIPLTMLLHLDWRRKLQERWGLFVLLFGVAALAVLSRRGILGSTYEIDAAGMLGVDAGPMAYPLSVVNQCGLFFKYALLWLWPNTHWMSIDMREPFARALSALNMVAAAVYVTWGWMGLRLLMRRGNWGLAGLAMLLPWLLFFTEFASVRIQEPFVLYRSYLWASVGLLAIPLLLNGIDRKLVAMVAMAIGGTFFVLSMERLITLSDPILLWRDAKELVERNAERQGADRIYYNLGRQLLLNHMFTESEENLKMALSIDPNLAQAHGALGAVYNGRSQWEQAISEYTIARAINSKRKEHPTSVYLMGRARAYEGAGKLQLAVDDYLEACRIDESVCEALRKSAIASKSR
jgi:protein O-mannosyl-transferase